MHHFLYDPETRLAICKDADADAASFPFPGVFLWENFISEEEEEKLISTMDQDVWNESQSGRRKQVMWNTCCFMNVSSTHTQRGRDQTASVYFVFLFTGSCFPITREQGNEDECHTDSQVACLLDTVSQTCHIGFGQLSLQYPWNVFCTQLTTHQLGVKQIGFQCNLLSKIVCTSFC